MMSCYRGVYSGFMSRFRKTDSMMMMIMSGAACGIGGLLGLRLWKSSGVG